jgi:hypothetical protein
MKTKHAILLIALGYCIELFGALQKVLHTALADSTLTLGSFVTIIGVLLLCYKLLTHPKIKDFLNW